MKTIWSFDLGKASIGEAVRVETVADAFVPFHPDRERPRKSRRAKLSLRSSEKKTLLNRTYPHGEQKPVCASNFVLNPQNCYFSERSPSTPKIF